MNDPTAESLWTRFATELRGWFAHRVSRPEDVDDLLGETFVRVLNGLDTVRDDERLGPWIRAVARNALTDWRRRHGGTRSQPLEDEPTSPTTAPDDDPQRVVASWLGPMIDTLPDADARVLRRSELEGETARSIAEDEGLSVSGVKSRVQRARKKLVAQLVSCCRIELDRRGQVIDWERREQDDCGACDDECRDS